MTTTWPTEEQHEQIRMAYLTGQLIDHDYARALPPQTEEEYRDLRKSIAGRGYDQGQPVVVWQIGKRWQVLDGRHRAKASREVLGALHMGDKPDAKLAEDIADRDVLGDAAAIEPTWIVFEGEADEALDLVEMRNLHGRRNFPNNDAKAMAAMHLYELRLRDGQRGRVRGSKAAASEALAEASAEALPATETVPFALTHPTTGPVAETVAETTATVRVRDVIAKEINVPSKTVARARNFQTHAVEVLGQERADELAAGIANGTVKLSQAEKEINAKRQERAREAARSEMMETAQATLIDDRLTIMVADVVEALRHIPDGTVGVAFIDPPYNLSHGAPTIEGGEFKTVDKGAWDTFPTFAAFAAFTKTWMQELERVMAPAGQLFISGTRHVHPTIGVMLHASPVFEVESDIVWRKTNAKPRATPGLQDDHELVWWGYKGKRRFARAPQRSATWDGPTVPPTERAFGAHSCQKPEWLVDSLFDLIDVGPEDLVLDLFAGSGTTSKVAIKRGCRVIAVDVDPQWESVIRARCAAVHGGTAPVPRGTEAKLLTVSELVAFVVVAVDDGADSPEAIAASILEAGAAAESATILDAVQEAFGAKLISKGQSGAVTLTKKGKSKLATITAKLDHLETKKAVAPEPAPRAVGIFDVVTAAEEGHRSRGEILAYLNEKSEIGVGRFEVEQAIDAAIEQGHLADHGVQLMSTREINRLVAQADSELEGPTRAELSDVAQAVAFWSGGAGGLPETITRAGFLVSGLIDGMAGRESDIDNGPEYRLGILVGQWLQGTARAVDLVRLGLESSTLDEWNAAAKAADLEAFVMPPETPSTEFDQRTADFSTGFLSAWYLGDDLEDWKFDGPMGDDTRTRALDLEWFVAARQLAGVGAEVCKEVEGAPHRGRLDVLRAQLTPVQAKALEAIAAGNLILDTARWVARLPAPKGSGFAAVTITALEQLDLVKRIKVAARQQVTITALGRRLLASASAQVDEQDTNADPSDEHVVPSSKAQARTEPAPKKRVGKKGRASSKGRKSAEATA